MLPKIAEGTGATACHSSYKAAMSTPIITARRNVVQRIANLLRKADSGELNLTPWQLSRVQGAIEQLEEERFVVMTLAEVSDSGSR